jgi:GNAT superfamily N-acetyltransferase
MLTLIREFCLVDDHAFDEAVIQPALIPLLADDALGQVWVLDEGQGDIGGYAIITWSWSLESGGRDCILDEIYVRRPGAGAGSRLLARAMRGAVEFGARAAFLETEAPNDPARRFYGRHGFHIEDSVWMSRSLP